MGVERINLLRDQGERLVPHHTRGACLSLWTCQLAALYHGSEQPRGRQLRAQRECQRLHQRQLPRHLKEASQQGIHIAPFSTHFPALLSQVTLSAFIAHTSTCLSRSLYCSLQTRVTRYDPISIWEIDVGDRYGRSDISEISIGVSVWDMGH